MAIVTYFLNASTVAVADPSTVWTNDPNAFDGNIATFATSGTAAGSATTNQLTGGGTNAPATGPITTNTIVSVRARAFGKRGFDAVPLRKWAKVNLYTAGGTATGQLIATAINAGPTSGVDIDNAAWGAYLAVTIPTGGWTWAKLQALEISCYISNTVVSPDFCLVYRVEIEVTYLASLPNNYQAISVGDGMSTSERIR